MSVTPTPLARTTYRNLLLLLALLFTLAARPARAQETALDHTDARGDEEGARDAPEDLQGGVPAAVARASLLDASTPIAAPRGARAPLTIDASIGGGTRASGRAEIAGHVAITIPLDRTAARASRPAVERRALFAAPSSRKRTVDAPEPSASINEASSVAPTVVVVRPSVSSELARTVIARALRHAAVPSAIARLDSMASRARASALLPELRLRASRVFDETQALSPTEYDPARVTASGGVSFWLEARTTFRLDRLIFADEEVAIERIRADQEERAARVSKTALSLLFAWQRARARRDDTTRDLGSREEAALEAVEMEVELDALTGGYFAGAARRLDASR